MPGSDESPSPKRRAIVDAATDLFAAHGYGAVSMDGIARAADVSKATLYAHFSSKDSLFATIVQVACRENIIPEDALPIGEAGADGETADAAEDISVALRAIGGRMLRFFLRDRSLAIHRLVIAESERFPELGRAFYDNGPAACRDILATWMVRRRELSVPNPPLAAEQFVGLLRTGLFLRATLGLAPEPDEASVDAAVTDAVSTFLRAYRA
jgi:TetR/AcrR family transcriptional repressor of mexJK operon